MSRAYRLFARLYRRGVTPELWPDLRELPVFAEALTEPLDWDDLAAEHHDLFSVQVFPYGGIFLEMDHRAAGAAANPVREAAALLGADGVSDGEPVDYLPAELDLLASLAEAEARGRLDAREAAIHVLSGHLLWWLPPFAVAVAMENRPFWKLLTELTLELALEHLEAAGGLLLREDTPLPGRASPRPPPSEGLDPGELAPFLTTPARSGLWLSPTTTRLIARPLGIPTGFGGRRKAIEELETSAQRYDLVPQFKAVLIGVMRTAKARHQDLASRSPAIGGVSTVWTELLDEAIHAMGSGPLFAEGSGPSSRSP
jgi:TorA maturation chaperone TorD